jgi:putative NADH-flavin reductase
MMKILIFGASGATGYNLVSQALRLEHFVTAFVRDPSKFKVKHANVKIFKGNVTDYHRVDDAMKGQDAVLSALGASSPFRRDFNLIIGIQNIVTAMMRQNIRRFVYQSFLGVKESRKELGFLINTIIPLMLKNVIADHEAKEAIIEKSNLDWTIVRCSRLTHGAFTGHYRDGEHILPSSLFPRISRTDVADFMLKQIAETKYLHKKPRIMY